MNDARNASTRADEVPYWRWEGPLTAPDDLIIPPPPTLGALVVTPQRLATAIPKKRPGGPAVRAVREVDRLVDRLSFQVLARPLSEPWTIEVRAPSNWDEARQNLWADFCAWALNARRNYWALVFSLPTDDPYAPFQHPVLGWAGRPRIREWKSSEYGAKWMLRTRFGAPALYGSSPGRLASDILQVGAVAFERAPVEQYNRERVIAGGVTYANIGGI